MSEETDTAVRYRARAEELRAIACSARDPAQKVALKKLAEEYEAFAATFETIDRSRQTVHRNSIKTSGQR